MSAEHIEQLEREADDLRHLLHDCHAAATDGPPVPFGRWLMDNGPASAVDDVRTLRDAYDDAEPATSVPPAR